MSIHVWNCRCGRRWWRFLRYGWDSAGALTERCPGCRPDLAETNPAWREL